MCAKKLFNYLSVAPYPPDGGHQSYEADTGGSPGRAHQDGTARAGGSSSVVAGNISGAVWCKGARVLALAVKDEDDSRDSVVAAVHLDANGEVVDFAHFHGLMQSNRVREDLKELKVSLHVVLATCSV